MALKSLRGSFPAESCPEGIVAPWDAVPHSFQGWVRIIVRVMFDPAYLMRSAIVKTSGSFQALLGLRGNSRPQDMKMRHDFPAVMLMFLFMFSDRASLTSASTLEF